MIRADPEMTVRAGPPPGQATGIGKYRAGCCLFRSWTGFRLTCPTCGVIRQTSAPPGNHELSLGQEALWFLQQLAPDSNAYNVSAALNLHDPVDLAVLAPAVDRVVARHPQLDRVFGSAGGRLRRSPGPTGPVLDVHDLGDADDRAVSAFATGLTRRPFRLDRERPIRIALLRRTVGPDVLLVAAHHIVLDNVSQVLVLTEILRECAGRPVPPRTGPGFDDFVRRERALLDSPRAAAARAYWRRELAGLPTGDLPTDLPRPGVYTFAGSEVDFELPPDLVAGAETVAAARGTTVFVVLFAAFQLLLHRFGGQDDFVVGVPVTLRSARRHRDSVGYFVNLMPFRVRVPSHRPFEALVRRTGDTLLTVLAHREFPYALIPGLVDVPRDPGRAGLVSTMFVMTASDPADPLAALVLPDRRAECAGITVSEFYLPQQQGQFDLTMQVLRHGAAARVHLKYNTSLFTATTVRGLAGRYTDLLRSAVRGDLC